MIEDNDDDSIEVTDEMIEAGREAAFDLSPDEVRNIYIAMERVRRMAISEAPLVPTQR